MKGKKYLEELLSNEFVIEEYKIEINKYVDELEQQIKKQKEVIAKIEDVLKEGHFEDSCDCLRIEELMNKYLKEVSE